MRLYIYIYIVRFNKRLENLYSSILIADNDSSKITISLEDLNSLIISKVQEEIQKNGGINNPTGSIISQMGKVAPEGYLSCNGNTYNIEEYKNLAEHINSQFGGYNYFGGDGVTTFAVPNLSGEFLRGTGTNSHIGDGNGSDVGVHQGATKIPFIYSGQSAVVYGFNSHLGTIQQNYDYQGASVQNGTVSFSNKNYNSQPQYYTSRPTNTSVLYCIKY